MSVALVDLVPLGQTFQCVKVGRASDRQFRTAIEGACPGCGSDQTERGTVAWSRFVWGRCPDCCWAEGFRAISGRLHPTIFRLLPTERPALVVLPVSAESQEGESRGS